MTLTNYHVGIIKKHAVRAGIILAAVFLIITVIRPFVKDPVRVDKKAYIKKDGFPFFVSQKDYISVLKSYKYNPGVKIKFHTLQKGESYWDIAFRNGITLDTLIAANPALSSLIAQEGTVIALPAEDGVLFACATMFDAYSMEKLVGEGNELQGEFIQYPFDLFCFDDVRFAFIKHAHPAVVNRSLEGLFEIKKTYQLPCGGHLVSLYGMRVDPIANVPDFHKGLDICSPYGTPIRPAKEGMVISTGWNEGYGLCITIMHDGGYLSIYGHCSQIFVEPGMIVGKDTIIGKIGSTGYSTGPHLHFEMRRHGENVNPLFFIW
jgi:murein DD-endopeptidase MepM/ murein hydrolase activator NlpD